MRILILNIFTLGQEDNSQISNPVSYNSDATNPRWPNDTKTGDMKTWLE